MYTLIHLLNSFNRNMIRNMLIIGEVMQVYLSTLTEMDYIETLENLKNIILITKV